MSVDPVRAVQGTPRGRWVTPASLTLAAVALGGIAVASRMILNGPIDLRLSALRLRSHDPTDSIAVSVAAALLLFLLGRRSRGWRVVAGSCLAAASAVALGFIARGGSQTWPVGDGALIELYTIHAVNGHQLLGAYSQYGWHHPGPLLFYWFAPFYVLSGWTTFGIDAGALFVNLLSLGLIGWLTARAENASPALAVFLFGLLVAYVVRVPTLLTSGWNPHSPVLPLLALMFITAAGLTGLRRTLPLSAFLVSFTVQSHVGLAMVAGTLFLIDIVVLGAWAVRRPDLRRAITWLGVGTVFLLEALWIAPMAEQLVNTPGNMTLIWRFFFAGDPGQSLAAASHAWSGMLLGVFRPDFVLASGVGFSGPTGPWATLTAATIVVALVPAAFLHERAGRPFSCALAVTCFVASLIGLWSVLRIRGVLTDHQVFWLSALGVVNLAVVLAAGAERVDRLVSQRMNTYLVWATAAAGIAVVSAVGLSALVAATRVTEQGAESATVRRLFEQLTKSVPGLERHRVVVRLDGGLWGIGTGVVLQLERASMPVSVAPEMVWLFGKNLAQTGEEDLLLTISRQGTHQELAARAQSLTLAQSGGYFIEGISLVDAPQYRP